MSYSECRNTFIVKQIMNSRLRNFSFKINYNQTPPAFFTALNVWLRRTQPSNSYLESNWNFAHQTHKLNSSAIILIVRMRHVTIPPPRTQFGYARPLRIGLDNDITFLTMPPVQIIPNASKNIIMSPTFSFFIR
jgi:hypothetical protein